MSVRTATTRLAIEPAWLATALSIMTRTGASRLTAIDGLRHAIARTQPDRPSAQGARFALRVDISRATHSRCGTLVSRAQADAAAAGAAGVVRLLIEGGISEPGAWMPEQVISPGPFLSRLAAGGLNVQLPGDRSVSTSKASPDRGAISQPRAGVRRL